MRTLMLIKMCKHESNACFPQCFASCATDKKQLQITTKGKATSNEKTGGGSVQVFVRVSLQTHKEENMI